MPGKSDRSRIPGWEGSIGPSPAQYNIPHVYARDVTSGAGNCVCGNALRTVPLHVQAAPGIPIPADTGDETIHMASGVSMFTGEAFVSLQWGGESGQLTPEEAENHARDILATAVAARIDAAVFAELTEVLEVPKPQAGAFLVALRKRTGRTEDGHISRLCRVHDSEPAYPAAHYLPAQLSRP